MATVEHVSESFIKLKFRSDDQTKPYYLGPGDLALLSVPYIQQGLLFIKPSSTNNPEFAFETFLHSLRDSLSQTLVHFYPLAGQLATLIDDDHHSSLIFINPDKGPGARFIHATLDMTIEDLLSPTDVPQIVQTFFDHYGAVSHDGHDGSLLSVEVTELIDGFFIGCSMNHVVGDGTSYWHFWNTWSEIHRTQKITVSSPPVHKRWVPEGWALPVTLPFTRPEEFLSRYEPPPLRIRIFHFASESISRLKMRANEKYEEADIKISSLQALCALVWRSVTRARLLAGDEMTGCVLSANTRQRIEPSLPHEYFGNSIWVVKATASAEELLKQNLGWAAMLLHRAVSALTDKMVRAVYEEWRKSPFVYHVGTSSGPNSVMVGQSPRFDVYGNDFGVGKPVAVRGLEAKYPGKVTAYPGLEGGGSMDLEICLPPDSMRALELDDELMTVAT